MIFHPTGTIKQFLRSQAFVQILMGPRSEGKTTGGIWKPLFVTEGLPETALPLKVAVVRDTWTNLRRTVMDTLHEQARHGLQIRFFADGSECLVGGNRVHLVFLGMDRPESINKLQGLGAGVLWIEEPAPAADVSGGIPEEVFGVGVTSLRQPNVPHWVQITMNPPDEDHWIMGLQGRLRELLRTLKLAFDFTIEFFTIPPGERVTAADRDRNRVALELIGRGDLVSRLVQGKVGQIILGEPVIPEFNDDVHVPKFPLVIFPGRQVIRMWDFGLNPSCVWSQVSPGGHWNVLGVKVGTNIGLEQLITSDVTPWEAEYLRPREEFPFRDIHDPAGAQHEQSNSEHSAVRVLVEMLDANPEPGPVPWADRRDALKAVLSRMIRGRAMVQIDPDCRSLIRALRGGFHYPKDGLGRITKNIEAAKRASGIHSHPVDCLGYGAAVLYPTPELVAKRTARKPKPRSAQSPSWMAA